MSNPPPFPGMPGKRPVGVQVPILGQPAGKVFTCANGHEQKGMVPAALLLPCNNGQTIGVMGGCPICFAEWMATTFPVHEVVDQPEQPELGPVS